MVPWLLIPSLAALSSSAVVKGVDGDRLVGWIRLLHQRVAQG